MRTAGEGHSCLKTTLLKKRLTGKILKDILERERDTEERGRERGKEKERERGREREGSRI